MRRLRKFFGLPAAERGLLLRALLLVAGIRFALYVVPFRHLRRLVKLVGHAQHGSGSMLPIRRLTTAVIITSRYVPRASCLTQALAAQVLLRRAGYPAYLRLGAARGAHGQFEAHAWVECDDQVVIGGSIERYAPFPLLAGDAS